MYRAVIFDFDYTLGDSTGGIAASVNYGLDKLGYGERSVDEIRKTIGLSLKETFFALTGSGDESRAEQFAEYFKEKADEVMAASAVLYPEAVGVLPKLKEAGCKIGIVTTKFHYRIDQILGKYRMNSLVDLIVGAEDVKLEKPDPEGLLWAVGQLCADKSQVLYVGDSPVDAETAERAEVDFAGVLTGTARQADLARYRHVCISEKLDGIYDFICRESRDDGQTGRRDD